MTQLIDSGLQSCSALEGPYFQWQLSMRWFELAPRKIPLLMTLHSIQLYEQLSFQYQDHNPKRRVQARYEVRQSFARRFRGGTWTARPLLKYQLNVSASIDELGRVLISIVTPVEWASAAHRR